MSSKDLSYDDLLQLVKVFESSTEFNEFHLKYGDVELDLRKHGAGPAPMIVPAAVSAPASPAAPLVAKPAPEAVAAPVPVSAPPAAIPAFPPGSQVVKSPMVGTFYRSPEPGATPFVSIGQRVTAETTVCIIEVMKLMTHVKATGPGTVVRIHAANGETVEFGTPLIDIAPAADTRATT